jgi:hypothetical protein
MGMMMAKKSRQVQRAAAAEKAAAAEGTRTTRTTRATRRPEAVRARKDARRKEFEKQQRQWLYTKIGIAALAVILIGFAGREAYQQYQEWQVTRDVDTYFGAGDFVATHNDTEPVLYEQVPPVGGYHRNTWQNCGFYDKYIENEYGVHSMEHGSVWITYDPNLPADDIETLKEKAEQQFVLVSPYPGLPSPVVASVWGKQILLDGANDDRLDPFISQYRKNPSNSPEPQGVCWSGVSSTTDTVPQQEPFVRQPNTDPVGGITASMATATAQALNPTTPTVAPTTAPGAAGTPPATPAGTPPATPEGTSTPTS